MIEFSDFGGPDLDVIEFSNFRGGRVWGRRRPARLVALLGLLRCLYETSGAWPICRVHMTSRTA